MYKFLLRLDYCVHAEQASTVVAGAGQTSAGAGGLGKDWTTSARADRLGFFWFICEVSPPKIL